MHSFCRTLIRGVVLAGLVAAWLAVRGDGVGRDAEAGAGEVAGRPAAG